MSELVLGPVVRFVDPEEATVWVETDRPCEVQVLGAASSTFAVDGHHYALVCIGVLSDDVHHAYVPDVAFRRDARVMSHVFQAVCSPFRNALDSHERLGVRIGMSRGGRTIGRALARAAGVDDPEIRWRVVEGPHFDNQVATLTLDGRAASIRVERAVSGADRPRLERLFERRLS